MFGLKKSTTEIDKEQLELIQNAQKRIKQKKRLYFHFVLFLIGSIFFIILNLFLNFGENFKVLDTDWFVFAILAWLFLLLYHTFNVFVTHKFMGKKWEERQLEKLVAKQKNRIEKLKQSASETKDKGNLEAKTPNNITIIAAVAENNVIGKDNKLIWHLSDDLKRFKLLTNGHHIIMGRKTFESFPKPLPNRIHIVITRQNNYEVPKGVIVVNTLEDALNIVKDDKQPFIIGGGEIYKQALSIADTIELTRVHKTFSGDTFFPEIDESIWKETSNIFNEKNSMNDYDFSFITYAKK